jgi:hypothetical protein
MKRIACLLSCSLILLWAFHGVTAAQQLTGLTGPLDGDSGPLGKITKATKEKVDEVLPSVEEAVDDVINEVENSTDKVVKDVSEVAKDSAGTEGSGTEGSGTEGSDDTAGSVAEEPTQARAPTPSKLEIGAPGSSDAGKKLAGSTKQSGTGSKDAPGAEPSDTDNVAAAGDTIESAQMKDQQLAAPEADVDQSEELGLSSTGAQVVALLVLASLLIAKRSRSRLAGTN